MGTKGPAVIVHGGAWALPDTLAEASRAGVRRAACKAYELLQAGGSALDVVETAVNILEDDPAFDAGTGAVLNAAGEIELDAVIMEGNDLRAGAVACVRNVANPVSLARLIMEKTDHTLLVGNGADLFAKEMGVKLKSTEELTTAEAREEFERLQKFPRTIKVSFQNRLLEGHDTVGAVVVDSEGQIAVATSTGGITAKRPGRVGDSPIIGSGAYCDNAVGGVSTTGHGEAITRVCLAHHITTLMSQGLSSQKAAEEALDYMGSRVKGAGGAIVLDPSGNIGMHFSTKRMAWAAVQDWVLSSGLDPGENITEPWTPQHETSNVNSM